MERTGRWLWWILRSWVGYGITFAVGWIVLGGVIDLLVPTPHTDGGESWGLVRTGILLFGMVGGPSLLMLLLSSGLRRRESFRVAMALLLLLPLLLPLLAGGGLGMVALLAVQLSFALWLMPSEVS